MPDRPDPRRRCSCCGGRHPTSRCPSTDVNYTLYILVLLPLVCLSGVGAQCKDPSLCSFMASEGECESDPEYMLTTCPKACKNPCLCPGISTDKACNCLVKAKEGYCDDPVAMTDCHSTCTKVTHESCPPLHLPADPNAQLSTWATRYLTTVTEVCDPGYAPVDEQNTGKKMCSRGQKWVADYINGQDVECAPVDCGPPPSSPNTFSMATSTTYGSTADYACEKDYVPLQGQATLTCNVSGLWEGQVLTCKMVDCGEPPSSPNSTVKVTSTSLGGTATYTCVSGFRQVMGDSTLTCSGAGTWRGNLIVCREVDCGKPPLAPNTQVVVQTTSFGSKANYTCTEGFTMAQEQMVLTCSQNGAWTPGPPMCSKVDCGQPPGASNTILTFNSTFYGATASYTCAQGYTFAHGDTSLTCGSQGSWIGALLSCTRVDCGQPPQVPHASFSVNNTFYGDTANYACSTGYQHVQGDLMICGPEGRWEGAAISCQKVDCHQPPHIPDAEVSVVGTLYGDTASYTCAVGYKYGQGDMNLTCGTTGSWEGVPIICQRVDCGQPPQVPHARFSVNNTFYGDTANYTCSTGYQHVQGDLMLTCGPEGRWEGSIISCQRVHCGQPPSVSDTNLTVKDKFFGDTANYTCVMGYRQIQGNTTLTCGATGSWEGTTISCQRVDCGQPPQVPHASFSVNNTFYGDTANYTCSTGYQHVQGDLMLTCGPEGRWEGSIISCQRYSCGKPPNGTNAKVTMTGTSYGDNATYSCLPGYTHVLGDTTFTCDSSGNWIGVLFTCQKKDCGSPDVNNVSDISFLSTTHGSQAVYTCSLGHERLTGDFTRVCLENDTWSGTALTCILIACGPAPVFEGARQWTLPGEGHLHYLDKCHYECFYEQDGREGLQWVMECGSDKVWVGDKPQCGANSPIKTPTFSHGTLEAPAAWAIGVAIFAILATIIILFVVLDCASLRKHSRYMRKNIKNFSKNVVRSLSTFRVWVKWKPNVVREGKFVLGSSPSNSGLSPSLLLGSFHAPGLQVGSSMSESSPARSTFLTVSSNDSRLVTPHSSPSIPKSPGSITLISRSEPVKQNTMPIVGF